jgi:hypothetical protein
MSTNTLVSARDIVQHDTKDGIVGPTVHVHPEIFVYLNIHRISC